MFELQIINIVIRDILSNPGRGQVLYIDDVLFHQERDIHSVCVCRV